jgi:hypothetical protein
VDGLADRWGWSAEGTGKRIWCEIDRDSEPRQAVAEFGGGVTAYEGFEFEGFAYEAV